MRNRHPRSAFAKAGLKQTIVAVEREIVGLYSADAIPWVVGYSGGKDSTAVLQLVWQALASLPVERRAKPVHVISTDTLVENPIVAAWVTKSLESMDHAARDQKLPVTAHRLTPAVEDSFWVNLIGRGYPAPETEVPLVHRPPQDHAVNALHHVRSRAPRGGHPRPWHPEGRKRRPRTRHGALRAHPYPRAPQSKRRPSQLVRLHARRGTGPTTTSGCS